MNKTNILKELKGLWNCTKLVNGKMIRRQCWAKNQWQIVDSLDFDKANIIAEYFYQTDLAKALI